MNCYIQKRIFKYLTIEDNIIIRKTCQYYFQCTKRINIVETSVNGIKYNLLKMVKNLENNQNHDYIFGFLTSCIQGRKDLVKILLVKSPKTCAKGLGLRCVCKCYKDASQSELDERYKIIKLLKNSENINFGLIEACKVGNISLVRKLFEFGANNVQMGFATACEKGHNEIINFLLAMEKININAINNGLLIACAKGHINTIKLLISFGADAFDDGLSNACENNDFEIIKLMIACGAKTCFYCERTLDEHVKK